MALALRDAGRDTTLFTLDVDGGTSRAAAAEAQARGVADLIVFVRGTVRSFARAYPHMRPALTFVDADHSAAGVSATSRCFVSWYQRVGCSCSTISTTRSTRILIATRSRCARQ